MGKALLKIFEMKAIFANFQDTEGKLKNKDYILVSAIVWLEIENGITKPLAQLAGFEDYADADIFKQEKEDTTTTATKSVVSKYCYASGEQTDDVKAINFETRYSLNKMFVTTTKNYLSNYQESFSVGNYQVSAKNQSFLEVGSKFVLDKLNISIAGITHCILPHVFSGESMSQELLNSKIKPLSEFLFNSEVIDKAVLQHLGFQNNLFWITFLGYESDGNSFKTINVIQDVNSVYLEELADIFYTVNAIFSNVPNIPWQRVNTFFTKDKERNILPFTFKTMYGCIPVRKDKEKKNVALSFFKAILEKRMIDPNQVFDFFRDLVLCHRFERYPSYKNIAPNSEFDFGLEKAVFHYLAIIQIIKKLKLFKNNYMEQQETTPPSVAQGQNDYQVQIDVFFAQMGYSENQKALFYLGRALDQIAYEQVKKKHSNKPILNKINYNGMDLAGVMSLHKELREKIVQYKAIKVEFNLAKFNTLINANQWNMSKSEAMFYLFSGYSFKLESEANKTDNN